MNNLITREDGFIFYAGAWRSPHSFERYLKVQRAKSKRISRRQQELRQRWIEENGPCRHCGSNERLQIDHIDPTEKTIRANILWRYSPRRITAELSKCQVLCISCHSKKTWSDPLTRPARLTKAQRRQAGSADAGGGR